MAKQHSVTLDITPVIQEPVFVGGGGGTSVRTGSHTHTVNLPIQAASHTYIFRTNEDEEEEKDMSREDQIQALRDQLQAARTAEEYNAVWVAGDKLGLRNGGRVVIPAGDGQSGRQERAAEEGPTDTMGRQVRVVKEADVYVDLDLRDDDETIEARLQGYAAKFNRETVIGFFFKFREKIAPGAFAKTIEEHDVRHLFNHDPTWVLGRNKSGTMDLLEDDTGLFYDVNLNMNDPQAISVAEKVGRGDVNQSSFAFIILRELWEESEEDSDELPLRTLLEVKLFDTSTVTYPAYEDTTALVANGARSAALERLGVGEELAELLAIERLTPDIADALRGVAARSAELADHCENGAPCPQAAEEAPEDGTAGDRAAEEAPDGDKGTDRDKEKDRTVQLGDQAARLAQLKELLADTPRSQEVN